MPYDHRLLPGSRLARHADTAYQMGWGDASTDGANTRLLSEASCHASQSGLFTVVDRSSRKAPLLVEIMVGWM